MTPTPTTRTSVRPTPAASKAGALARCVAPVSAEEFRLEHWERRPLLVPRGGASGFDDLLSEADVERLVCSTAIRYPAFRMVRGGGQLDLGAYTADVPWRPAFTKTANVPRVL